MNRGDLHLLAELRVEDARILLEAGRFAGAYYLLGYAVECALKACVAKLTREHDFPDKQLVLDSYTHDLEQLLQISGVEREFDARVRANRAFAVGWTTARDCTEAARYDNNISVGEARELLKAVTDAESGVLTWLKTVW
jgi:HEPN domain-containing protein